MGFKVESKNWIEVVKEDIGHKTCRNPINVIKIKNWGKSRCFLICIFALYLF